MKRIYCVLVLLVLAVVGYAQTIPWPAAPYPKVNINFSAAIAQTIVAAPTAGGVCVYGLQLINSDATTGTTVSIYEDGGTTAIWTVYLAAVGGAANWQLTDNAKSPYFLTNKATGFVIKSSAAVQINGGVYAANCP